MTDQIHDPGPAAARARADAVQVPNATVIRPPSAGAIRVGTAGWTDPSLTAAGVFYPATATSAEDRLRYFASRFPIVEIDATYYALPTRQLAERWLLRTPDDFTFNIKAFALMTKHPTETRRLPKEFQAILPSELRGKNRVYSKDLSPELEDAVWDWFIDAIEPLHSSGKLGAVLLQYPPWFGPSAAHRAALVEAKRRLGGIEAAIEFRNRRWFDTSTADRTLRFLADQECTFVMVDEPQGFANSVPAIVAVTSPRLAMVRMHGRRGDTWYGHDVPVDERFRYLYSPDELQEWVPKVLEAAEGARDLHVIYNNCRANYGTTNALEFTQLLAATLPSLPDVSDSPNLEA